MRVLTEADLIKFARRAGEHAIARASSGARRGRSSPRSTRRRSRCPRSTEAAA